MLVASGFTARTSGRGRGGRSVVVVLEHVGRIELRQGALLLEQLPIELLVLLVELLELLLDLAGLCGLALALGHQHQLEHLHLIVEIIELLLERLDLALELLDRCRHGVRVWCTALLTRW